MNTRREFNLQMVGLLAVLPIAACTTTKSKSEVKAIDCHAHVFMRDLPMPDKRRAPSGYDAPPDAYLKKLDDHGMTHGVIVQPSFLGTDNSYLVAALRQYPNRLRGIAVVEPTISVAELDDLQHAGVVGIRLNLVGLKNPDFSAPVWQRLLRELKQRHWQVEVHQLAGELQTIIDPLVMADIHVVVDHFGRPDPKLGIEDPGFQYLLQAGNTGKVYVKLSGAYRNGANGQGQQIAMAAIPLLKKAYGTERLVWGSDWPHTLFEKSILYSDQRNALDTWLPDMAERQTVLGMTPAKLFQFA